ncbi:hypothetical protein C8R47DRAFT_1324625 [Mycena vitilis]|nr:hypothetical protein C8R47DRAFT_1324625 [Mycena vitilis]
MPDLCGRIDPCASSKFDAPVSPVLLEVTSTAGDRVRNLREILTRIPYVSPQFFSPLLLCRICRLWRQIALSTPTLWSAISIDAGHDYADDDQAAQRFQLVKTWLTRSRHSPLSLRLTGIANHIAILRQLVEAVVTHHERWERVHLVVPEMEPETHPPLKLFEHAAQLKSVVLTENFLLYLFHLPWAQLTHIKALCLYAHECPPILESATQIVRCDFTICDDDNTAMVPIIPVQSNLRYLSLVTHHYNPDVDLCSIVSQLTTPTLRVLQIFGLTLECLQAFIQRSNCVLEKLCIAQSSYLSPSIEAITLDLDEPI